MPFQLRAPPWLDRILLNQQVLMGAFFLFSLSLSALSWLMLPKKIASLTKLNLPFNPNLNTLGLLYGIVTLGLYLSYLGLLFHLSKKRVSLKRVWIMIFVSSFFFLSGYPAFSKDVLNYSFTAKIVTLYHQNPFQVVPKQFSHDPWLDLVNWKNLITPYGPAWITLSLGASWLGQSHLLLTIFLMKITVALFHLGVLGLIQMMARKTNPQDQTLYLALYGLNPLVLLETLLNGHNDAVMVFFLLVSIYHLTLSSFRKASLYWAVSFLVKKVTLVLTPFYLLAWWAKRTTLKISLPKTLVFNGLFLISLFLVSPFRTEASIPQELHPWYLVWFFPLFVIAGHRQLIKAVIAASFFLSLAYLPEVATKPSLAFQTTLILRELSLLGLAILTYLTAKHLKAILETNQLKKAAWQLIQD